MLKQLKNNEELITILRDAGIVTKEYANPNVVGNAAEFIISTIPGGRGILVKNSNLAKVSVVTDKKYRQAVLAVKEGKRTLIRKVSFIQYISTDASNIVHLTHVQERLIGKFPIAVPGAKFTVTDITSKEIKDAKTGDVKGWAHSGIVTAKVGRSRENTFLLGMDETSHFISVLPKKVASVKAAHKLLKPKGVKQGTKRQGEFFFVPTDKQFTDDKVRKGIPLERGSAHNAQYAIPKEVPNYVYDKGSYDGVTYVKGLIYDKRGYRHAPVDLGDKWHKVVRNKESMTAVPKGTRAARRYD